MSCSAQVREFFFFAFTDPLWHHIPGDVTYYATIPHLHLDPGMQYRLSDDPFDASDPIKKKLWLPNPVLESRYLRAQGTQ